MPCCSLCRWKCSICDKGVLENCIQCFACKEVGRSWGAVFGVLPLSHSQHPSPPSLPAQWAHYSCGGIDKRLDMFMLDAILWVCATCIERESARLKPKAKSWQDFVREDYHIANIQV